MGYQGSPAIRVAELKSKPLSVAIDRLMQARHLGLTHLDVLNRGRPIFHLGRQEDLPRQWRGMKPESLPHIDLRKGKVSLTRLRGEGKVYMLTQRGGPSLVLWPLEEDYARPPEVAVVERLDAQQRQIKTLRLIVRHLEETLDKISDVLTDAGYGERAKEEQRHARPADEGEEAEGGRR